MRHHFRRRYSSDDSSFLSAPRVSLRTCCTADATGRAAEIISSVMILAWTSRQYRLTSGHIMWFTWDTD